MAIEDGAVLTRALGMASTLPEALQLYQRNRIDRTARIVNQSSENHRLFHLRSKEEIRSEFAQRDEGADRIAALEATVEELRREVADLRNQLEAFRKQFE